MSATAPWSVKGIDPKAREIAKDLARRSGMTLGEWLNSVIMDEPEVDGTGPRPLHAAYGREADTDRAMHALVAELGRRLEEAERRSASAIQGIDQAVAGLMRRMDSTRDQEVRHERRLDDIARELRDGHQRLKALETRDMAVSAEALKQRLDLAEDATRMALQGLERSFAALEQRFAGLEDRSGPEANALGELATRLTRQIEANRQDLLRRLAEAGDGARLSRIEQTLEVLGRQTAATEKKSARAVEAMGHEIMRIAQNMNGRMQTLEQTSGGVSLDQRLAELGRVLDEKLDREIARHTQSLDSRLNRQEDQHALALERLGGEITRISDRLSERISQTERRSSQAIEDIGRRLAESSEKLERRAEDVSGEMAERIRQSEERTRLLLEEAMEARARREAEARFSAPRLTAVTPPASSFDDVPEFISGDEASVSLFEDGTGKVSAPVLDSWDETVAQDVVEPFAASEEPQPFGVDEAHEEPADAAFAAGAQEPVEAALEPVAADDPFPSIFASDDEAGEREQGFAAPPEGGSDDYGAEVLVFRDAEPVSAADDQLQSAEVVEEGDATGLFGSLGMVEAVTPLSTRDAIDHARAAIADEEPEPARKTFGLGKLRRKGGTSALQQKLDRKAARDGSTFGQALKVSALAMLVVGGGGYGTLKLLQDHDAPRGAGPTSPETTTRSETGGEPMAALVLDTPPADAVPSQAVASTEGAAVFARATDLLDKGDAAGVEPMRRAAAMGYVPAQMRLAALYTDGGAGIAPDAAEARQWVRRAAEAGDPRAMQHYATQLYDGTGGTKDEKSALYWMQKSAEAGSVDSQFNVAHLYEKGVKGVAPNKVEAFTWYMIAATRGDRQALEAVQRLTPTLSDAQRRTAREAAQRFKPTQP